MSRKEPLVVLGCGVAIIREGRILLSQRLDESLPGVGLWAMPGGTVDEGEWPAKAARREVTEETGMRTVDIRPLPFWHWTDKWLDYSPWVTLYFHATVVGGEPRNMEPHKHSDWRWCDPRNLPQPLWTGIEDCCRSLGLL